MILVVHYYIVYIYIYTKGPKDQHVWGWRHSNSDCWQEYWSKAIKNRKVKALPAPAAPGRSLEDVDVVSKPPPLPKQAAKAKSPPPKAGPPVEMSGRQELGPLEFRLGFVLFMCKEMFLQILFG